MTKLKSFEEYVADIDSAEEIENTELEMGEPTEAEGEEEVITQDQEEGGDLNPAEVEGEEAGEEVEDMDDTVPSDEQDVLVNGEEVDEEPKDISDEIEGAESDDEDESDDDDDEDESDDDDDEDESDDDEDVEESFGFDFLDEAMSDDIFISEATDDFAGWIAFFNGKKVEITKDEAKDLWGAKKLAIAKMKVPKSKEYMVAIAPAVEEMFISEAEVDIIPEINGEFMQLYSKLHDLGEETTDSNWRKAIDSIIKNLENVEGKIEGYAKKLGIVPVHEDSTILESCDKCNEDPCVCESEETKEEVAKEVAEMLKECYDAAKNEAKAWEADMHDEHTVESYLKENAALVAALAVNALKECKEEMTLETYEGVCNELKESYAKKIEELKESFSADGDEIEVEVKADKTPEASDEE